MLVVGVIQLQLCTPWSFSFDRYYLSSLVAAYSGMVLYSVTGLPSLSRNTGR